MSCNDPDHAQLEEELGVALDDVMRLEEELQISLRKGGKSQGVATAAEVAALVEANDKLSKEKERYREDALTQKGRVRDLEAEMEAKGFSLKELEKKRRKMEDDLENTRKMLQAEKSRAADAAKQLGATEKKGRTEQKDQAKLLTELQELRELAADLHAQLTNRDEAIAELHANSQHLMELNATLAAQVEDHQVSVEELQHKLEETRLELTDAQDALAVSAENEDELERRVEEEEEKAAAQAEVLNAELIKQRAAAAAAQAELAQLRAASDCAARDREAAALKHQLEAMAQALEERDTALVQAGEAVQELEQQLHAAERRAVNSSKLSGTVGGLDSTAYSSSSRGGAAAAAAAGEHRAAQQHAQALQEEAERYSELEARKNAVERELEDAEAWKAKYEAAHGLTDAVRYQKQLKRDLQRAQTDLEQRSQALGEALDALEAQQVTCQRLKKEAGRPADFTYPDLPAVKPGKFSQIGASPGRARNDLSAADTSSREAKRIRQLEADLRSRDVQLEKLERAVLEQSEQADYNSSSRGTAARAAAAADSSSGDSSAGDLRSELSAIRAENRELRTLMKEWSTAMLKGSQPAPRTAVQTQQHTSASSSSNGVSSNSATVPPAAAAAGRSAAAAAAPQPVVVAAAEPAPSRWRRRKKPAKEEPVAKPTATSAAGATSPTAAAAAKLNAATGKPAAPTQVAVSKAGASPVHSPGRAPVSTTSAKVTAATAGAAAGAGADAAGALRAQSAQHTAAAASPVAAATGAGSSSPKNSSVVQLQQRNQHLEQQLAALQSALAAASRHAAGGSSSSSKPVGTSPRAVPAQQQQQQQLADTARLLEELARLQEMVAASSGGMTGQPTSSSTAASTRSRCAGNERPAAAAAVSPRAATAPAAGVREPATAHGKQLLHKQLRHLNLPPEEWAGEVRDLNAQLVEALEQLCARESELDEHEAQLRQYEGHLGTMRAQVAVLYREHAAALQQAQSDTAAARRAAAAAQQERDRLTIKCRNLETVLGAESAAEEPLHSGDAPQDPDAVKRLARDLSRRVTAHEVNEQELLRRYASMEEQLQLEAQARARAEGDLIEAETACKTRILFLEQYKCGASERLARQQVELEKSVPATEAAALTRELCALRADHLRLLEQEAEARLQVAKHGESQHAVRKLTGKVTTLTESLAGAEAARAQAELALSQQQQVSAAAAAVAQAQLTALQGGALTADLTVMIEEVARFQSQAAKAEVERATAVKRLELQTGRLTTAEAELAAAQQRCSTLQLAERAAHAQAASAREAHSAILEQCQGGATSEEGESLRRTVAALQSERAGLLRETERCRELADIASEQAQAVGHCKRDAEDELAELRRHVADLEARSDDDLIIGRLQRRLMALRAAYRAFARKHEATRANLRRKAAALRLLEGRLDAREEALHTHAERSRAQVAALKGALAQLGDSGATVITHTSTASPRKAGAAAAAVVHVRELNLARGREFSTKVAQLSALLETRDQQLAEAEKAQEQAEAAAEAAQLERSSAQRLLADLRFANTPPTSNNTNNSSSSSDVAKHSADVTRRVTVLSEDLRAAQLSALAAQRSVAALKRERRHLEAALSAKDEDIRGLEEAHSAAQKRALLGHTAGYNDSSSSAGAHGSVGIDMVLLSPRAAPRAATAAASAAGGGTIVESSSGAFSSTLTAEERALLSEATAPQEFDFGGLEPEQALTRLRDSSKKVVALTKALAAAKAAREQALTAADAAEHRAAAAAREVTYYVRLAKEAGLPALNGSETGGTGTGGASPNGKNRPGHKPGSSGGAGGSSSVSSAAYEEHLKLQQAASATVASLKTLLQEKNATIDRMQRRLDEARADRHRDAGAERVEVGRLTNKIYQDTADSLEQLRRAIKQLASGTGGGALDGANGASLNARLMDQLDEVASVLAEKDTIGRQLELKLKTASNQKERAEERCGEALCEMERMRADMITLAAQLQDAEERALAALEDTSGATALAEARASLRAKEGKLRALRGALIRLKQEFVKAEEAREDAALRAELQRGRVISDKTTAVEDRVTALREQMQTLQAGLLEAKDELERSRRTRERLTNAKDQATAENERLASELAAAQAAASASEDAMIKARRDLDASKQKEERLRQKIQSLQDAGESKSGNDRDGSKQQLSELERKVQALTAQNAALKSAAADHDSAAEAGEAAAAATAEAASQQRQEKHRAWEAEKKLRKRIESLEKRLEERTAERTAAEEAAATARTANARLTKERDALLKASKAGRISSTGGDDSSKRSLSTAATAAALETARARIFDLEEECTALRRAAEVDLPAQIESLKHQVRSLRAQLEETDARLEQSERRSKAAAIRQQGGGLLAEEELFHEAEALRDEITVERQKRRELESELLDRDAASMSVRFDLEAQSAELQRLQRRHKELEQALHAASVATAAGPGVAGTGMSSTTGGTPGGSRFNRERDLEGVVDALKRAVEKLRSENERLRRSASDPVRAVEGAKKLKEQRHRIAELTEENTALRAKAAIGDDSIQRLAQKQDLVNQLRRQLRARDESLTALQRQLDESAAVRSRLEAELHSANAAAETARRSSGGSSSSSSSSAAAAAELVKLRREAEAADRMIRELRGSSSSSSSSDVARLKAEVARLRSELAVAVGASGSGSSGGGLAVMQRLEEQVESLQQDNERLNRELQAFDLDFFEEIEDLKYKYAEAVRRLRTYEG